MENIKKFQNVGRTKVVNGSILMPENSGLSFVLNIANMLGKTDNPLYPIFNKKWKKVKEEVRGWYVTKTGAYKLGAINNIAVQSDVWIINMLCQNEKLETDVKALEECLKKTAASAKYEKASIHVSTLLVDMIPQLPELLQKHIVDQGISLYFYQEK